MVTYGELLVVGAATGLLDSAVEETGRALGILQSERAEPGKDEVGAEAQAFRRARGLQSGEDLRAWLAGRRLTRADWEGHLRRLVAARSEMHGAGAQVPEAALHEALSVDLACGGWWGEVARAQERYWSAGQLAATQLLAHLPTESSSGADRAPLPASVAVLTSRSALFGPLDPASCAAWLARLSSRREALEGARRHFSSASAVAGRIADHLADWVEFTYDSLLFARPAAAAEALRCAEDGLSPDEIAQRSGLCLERHRARRSELPAGTAALLAGAAEGAAVGPVLDDGASAVLWLRERRPPSPEDAAICRAAAEELLAEALSRAGAGRARAVGVL